MSCLCVFVHLRLGKGGTAPVASMEIGRHGRQRYQYRTRSNRGFCTTWDFHLYNKASLLFNTLPRQTFSYTSASILDKRDHRRPWPKPPRNNGSRETGAILYGLGFFTITVRGVILSMFIRLGYSLADTKTVCWLCVFICDFSLCD